jgi:hypothetical protein
MKVFAGCYVDAQNPENLPDIRICASEKELVLALAEDGDVEGGSDCNTLTELQELMEEQYEEDDGDISYNGITWEERDL